MVIYYLYDIHKREDKIMLFLIYAALGYWATGKTVYAGKIVIYTFGQLFLQRLIIGTLLGWILIPWAVIKMLVGSKA